MFQGLSRRTLNGLIIVCLLTITGINLGLRTDEDTPLEPIDAAPLADTGWHLWQSREGVPVYWQSTAGRSLTVAISAEQGYALRTTVDASDWAQALAAEITGTRSSEAGIALQGPLSENEMQQAAAFIIQRRSLIAPPPNAYPCQQAFPAGALWWARAQGMGIASPVPAPEISSDISSETTEQSATPSRDEWQTFRKGEIKRMRQAWLSAPTAIDIAADLAYHRWPDDYFLTLYQALAESQRTAPQDFADCQRAR